MESVHQGEGMVAVVLAGACLTWWSVLSVLNADWVTSHGAIELVNDGMS